MANKCHVCNKKLKLSVQFACKCSVFLCLEHRFPDSHACSFNFVDENKKKLNKILLKVDHAKIQKI